MRANRAGEHQSGGGHHFNSRPRMRANHLRCSRSLPGLFQLPPSHEGEHTSSGGHCSPRQFQLPPSHEGEPHHARRGRVIKPFQLPPSHEGEHASLQYISRLPDVFQLPPSHEGEQGCAPVSYTHLDVYKRQPLRRSRNWSRTMAASRACPPAIRNWTTCSPACTRANWC